MFRMALFLHAIFIHLIMNDLYHSMLRTSLTEHLLMYKDSRPSREPLSGSTLFAAAFVQKR